MTLIAMLIFPSRGAAIETQLKFSEGLRSDGLDWNIAGTMAGTNPNILSELTWENVLSHYMEGELTIRGERKLFSPYIWLFGGYGWIFDGENQDSDYFGNNRTLEFSRSKSDADDGEVWDFGANLGLAFQFSGKNAFFSIIPFIGYTYRAQDFTMTNGVQVLDPYSLFGGTGPFPGLDNSYETRWYGPLTGLRLEYKLLDLNQKKRFMFWLEGDYTRFDYEAEANWNLRTDFAHPKSFEHSAEGDGYKLRGGFDFFLTKILALGFKGEYTDWTADKKGVDKVYFADGTTAKTKLNEVNWESWSAMLALSLVF
ncbi:MAG: TonB-dependent receptor [Deltaproteobacteria bacterium]|nr:TonB-dependent receptor [Deltaproteobacteria bacterium]